MEWKTIKKITFLVLAWVFFPIVSVAICQTDAPQTQSKVPLNPKRVYKVTTYLLTCLYENLTGPFIPSILQYGWHKLSSERKRTSVRKNIRYGPGHRNRLDIYLPDRVSTTVFMNNKIYNDNMGQPASHSTPIPNQQQNDTPVIIFIGTSWNSVDQDDHHLRKHHMYHSYLFFNLTGNRATCMPVAHNLQSQGYIVIVPDITLYPNGRIANMVADVQKCISWTHTHISSFRGDPSQIYLMGHGAGSLLSALTIVHDACATLNVLPSNNTDVNIPVWDNIRRTTLPRVQGLILFSGVYDITYYYAYLYQRGLEQVHALPRVMGNKPEAFLQCSPTYLLSHALDRVQNIEQLKALLPRKVVLIHGEQQDTFSPAITARNFYFLLDSAGIPSVQLKIYNNIKHISPKIDLIVPTKSLCVKLLEDVKECCKGQGEVVIVGGKLKEKRDESEEEIIEDNVKRRGSSRRKSQVRR
ncbi:8108_t:CDS:2 [Funneliformis geosporum]|uniref:18063_t:CDS:1 n=1 Tax=Funneliformis geosporum TaxID=1117311 RepID=A0A9W4SWP5_9GLOM|nr:8108_t:CDS:2 [Funneliformis geosporum]CAI2184305.1 18063_t:CDS:2 [Funneliformis geosporum]